MFVFRKTADLQRYLEHVRQSSRLVGFVPTMGALHEGHLELVRRSLEDSDCTVVSIFVNPTQFNEQTDFEKYPVDLQKDIMLLHDESCEVVWIPDVDDVYPDGGTGTPAIDLQGLDARMEGKFRPGHFDGVAQVMERLLRLVEPDDLYMGQKDFQQTVIIRHLIRSLKLPIRFVMCPTIREPHGLAMSSRNLLLPDDLRDRARVIYLTLDTLRDLTDRYTPADLQRWAMRALDIPGFRPEYVEIVDATTLQPVDAFEDDEEVVACCAVWAGDVRLIDNVFLKD
ncbi:MAG: pantoate--beta-alanine ligase [Saprospiraceae bacterium]|nr:pantoate--beta-alanine ligase [Saprospiraceae bacterium]